MASAAPAPPRAAARASPRMRLLFGVLVLVLMFALVAPMFRDTIAHEAPQPVAGDVSYRGWGPLSAPVELGGTWRLTWLGQDDADTPPGATAAAPVPGKWGGIAVSGGSRLPPTGAAAYTVVLRDLAPGRYTLYIPIAFAADAVYIDERLVERRGTVATNAAGTRYHMRSHEIPVEATGAPLVIRVDLAAFLHRDSGIGGTPIFGLAEPMRRWTALEWMKNLALHSALLLLGLNALITFLFRRQDRASLFLAVASFCAIPGTAILSYDNLLLLALPELPFTAMLALQYLATTAAIGCLFAYIATLYPRETPRWLARSAIALVALYFVAVSIAFLFATTYDASRIAIVWPLVSGFTLLGAIAVVLRAGLRGRDGALILLLGFAVFTFFVLNATLGFAGVPQRYLFGNYALPLGMLMWLFSHFIVLAERWTLAIDSAERINADLRQLIEVNSAITSEMQLDQLLARIVE
ncbi:MAG: 7TM diverse intracellular signaling domain-containing protein, partial [Sphingomonas sp.]